MGTVRTVAEPTPHAAHLLRLAGRVAGAYVQRCDAKAALVAGSVAEGISDEWSDIDLILFYDDLPQAEALVEQRSLLGGSEWYPLGGSHEGGAFLEQFRVDGVACQLVHETVAAWRAQAASVLEHLEVDTPVQKALSGLHEGVVLHGGELISELRHAATYPDALAEAMVVGHLQVFPLWRFQESFAGRDAALWQHAELVNALQNLLAVLAGVNRRFFSTFQLKKVRRLVAEMEHAPADLADRIESALTADPATAAAVLRDLVADTVAVVEARMPGVDVGPLRGTLGPPITPWTLPA